MPCDSKVLQFSCAAPQRCGKLQKNEACHPGGLWDVPQDTLLVSCFYFFRSLKRSFRYTPASTSLAKDSMTTGLSSW